jgi:hypothetical protein
MQVLGYFWRKATMAIHGSNLHSVDVIITAGLLLKPGNTPSKNSFFGDLKLSDHRRNRNGV